MSRFTVIDGVQVDVVNSARIPEDQRDLIKEKPVHAFTVNTNLGTVGGQQVTATAVTISNDMVYLMQRRFETGASYVFDDSPIAMQMARNCAARSGYYYELTGQEEEATVEAGPNHDPAIDAPNDLLDATLFHEVRYASHISPGLRAKINSAFL